jgi:hypothetical protein
MRFETNCSSVLTLCILSVFPGVQSAADCNKNGVDDSIDIQNGVSHDCNLNSLPDECDVLPVELGYIEQSNIRIGKDPIDLIAADLDGDRDLDLASANETSGDVSVILNNGNGRFASSVSYPAGNSPRALAAADLDGDGRPELVGANSGSRSVSILKNSGAGAFAASPDLTLSSSPVDVAATDLDGDGDSDLAVLSVELGSVLGSLTIFLNKGGGELVEGSTFTTRRQLPVSLAAGDLDGNGSVDLAAANSFSGDVSVFLNDGAGAFRVAPDFPIVGASELSITPGDLDRDGDLDLAVALGFKAIVALLNRGNGTFLPGVEYAAASQPVAVSVIDLDQDGNLDLVAADRFSAACGGPGAVWALYNRGNGIFREPLDLRVDFDGRVLALADVDQDGDPELVLDSKRSEISVLVRELKSRSSDCNQNGMPDECELAGLDCNVNRVPDSCDVERGESGDCNHNGLPDECEGDCNGNSVPDECDLTSGSGSPDCDQNGIPDECELATGDRDSNGIPDECDIRTGRSADCNSNGFPDPEDLRPALRFLTSVNLLAGEASLPVLADMDGDGDPDLAGTQPGTFLFEALRSGSVWVFFNDGRGSFLPGASAPVGLSPGSLHSADLDRDGDLDLLVANAPEYCPRIEGWVSVVLNRGNGQLALGERIVAGSYPLLLGSGDLNGDGDQDIVVTNGDFPSKLLLFLKDPGGTFRPAGALDDISQLPVLAIADLDGDHDLDLAAAHVDSPFITFFYNNGQAIFPARMSLGVDFSQVSIVPADLDGDKNIDLVLGLSECSNLGECPGPRAMVLWNDGNRAFEQVTFPLGPRSGPVIVEDLDGDRDLDLAAAGASSDDPDQFGSPQVAVLLNNGRRAFGEPRLFLVQDNAECAGSGDLDRDGDADLILQDKDLLRVSLVSNLGDGSFAAPRLIPSSSVPDGLFSLLAADLDGDRDVDLAGASSFGVKLFANQGDGGFEPGESIPLGSNPVFLLAEDLNGDGLTDLAIVNPAFRIEVPRNVSIILNQGAGRFAPARNYAVGFGAIAMAAADLDGDLDLDLAVANRDSDFFSVLRNNGNGTFQLAVNFAARLRPIFIAAADLDGDRDVDLAMADLFSNGGRGKVSIFTNSGQATFSGEVELPVGLLWPSPPVIPQALTAADLDGDRDQDLAVAGGNVLSVLLNRGDGTFLPAVERASGNTLAAIVAADLDGDGDLDLVAPDTGFADVAVFLNAGDGTFAEPAILAPGLALTALATGDLDGDRDLDLALAGFGGPDFHLVVIENVSSPFSRDQDRDGAPDECRQGNDRSFRRGDANQDSRVDLSDAVTTLKYLFQGGRALECNKAADANDDARIDLSDAAAILLHLFSGQGPLPEPYPSCGKDPTPDLLGCGEFLGCGG